MRQVRLMSPQALGLPTGGVQPLTITIAARSTWPKCKYIIQTSRDKQTRSIFVLVPSGKSRLSCSDDAPNTGPAKGKKSPKVKKDMTTVVVRSWE